jgi:outer membrane receptor protein involved in Fe transport
VQVTDNVGDSRNYGFEFSADTRLTKELTLSTAFGMTKAVWGNAIINNPNTGVNLNLNGLNAPFVPKYQGSVSLDWSHPISDDVTFGLRADASFVGRQYWDLDTSRRQESYQLVNLSARLEMKNWELSAHVSNLFDRKYNTEYYTAAEVGASTDIAAIGAPRLATVELTVKF